MASEANGDDAAGCRRTEVELFLALTEAAPFSGGSVALAAHPSEPRLFVSVQELGEVLEVSTLSGAVSSRLEVPDSEEGPRAVAFDEAGDCLLLLLDDRLTRWRGGPRWAELGEGWELPEDSDCECLSADGRGRVLLDLSPPAWLLPDGALEPLPLEPLPEGPPKATDGDTEAVYRRQHWEATTVDYASALLAADRDGGVFFYARDSRSVHHLPAGGRQPLELSVRRERHSRGVIVHMESDVPEDGRCCASPSGGVFVVGPVEEEKQEEQEEQEEGDEGGEAGFALWSFAPGKRPEKVLLRGFRHPPTQLDAIAADSAGRVYMSVVERWPDCRAIYRVALAGGP